MFFLFDCNRKNERPHIPLSLTINTKRDNIRRMYRYVSDNSNMFHSKRCTKFIFNNINDYIHFRFSQFKNITEGQETSKINKHH